MRSLKDKIVSLFNERDVSFYDAFQSVYDPLNAKASIITIADFKKRIRQLNLPLTVQEHRILRRIADPKQVGKVHIGAFCNFFETPEIRMHRLQNILDRVATAFYLQGFNMRRAFALFDIDGDGDITAREFRQGMAALNLHLRYDEIDDLMRLCDVQKNGKISYDEFISKMDLNIRQRQGIVSEKVEDAFIQKLSDCIAYSRDSLYQIMKQYDVDGSGTIEAFDLGKVIKKLGIMNPEPHIATIMKIGGS